MIWTNQRERVLAERAGVPLGFTARPDEARIALVAMERLVRGLPAVPGLTAETVNGLRRKLGQAETEVDAWGPEGSEDQESRGAWDGARTR